MAQRQEDERFERIRVHAFARLSVHRRERTNLYLDHNVFAKGEHIGPPRQKIVAERPTLLVFADEDPMANFAHACRYLLYAAESGEFYRELPARFPPWTLRQPETLQIFHEPVAFVAGKHFPIRPAFLCPRLVPDGERYAVLWSGMSNKRHLNDMEFLYRTLVDHYGFKKKNIYAYSYDGTLNTQDGIQAQWPGDGTAYRITINGSGTRAQFESAIDTLKPLLANRDLLLIHTNNHGGYDGTPGTANLCTYPNWDAYYANDFADKVGELPSYRSLIVMMEQCHAGGFNAPIIAQSTAGATSIASAALEPNNSFVSADGNWDPFARDWIAAEAGHDAFGGSLAHNADTDLDGVIEADEAFTYADSVNTCGDTPIFGQSSAAGADISLSLHYRWACVWCWVMWPLLEKRYMRRPAFPVPPDPAFYERVQKALPELQKRILPEIDKAVESLAGLTSEADRIIDSVFGER